jgi:hypothetical protein
VGYFYISLDENQYTGPMKYSYPGSLIALSAAFMKACSVPARKYDNDVADIEAKDSRTLKFNIKDTPLKTRVGIKFDNISAGKYFALIHRTQQQPGK